MTALARGPRDQPGSSGQNLGDRYVVERWADRWQVTDLNGDARVGPIHQHHDDAQHAAEQLNAPRRRPTTQQGDLFSTTKEA